MINLKKNIEFLPNIINNFRFQMDSYIEKIMDDIYLNVISALIIRLLIVKYTYEFKRNFSFNKQRDTSKNK